MNILPAQSYPYYFLDNVMCSDSQRNCYETKQNLHVITFWVAVFPVCILI